MLYTADKLGEIIKTSRLKMGLTRDQLSEKIGISPRYLMSIEHEGKKPSYDVLLYAILQSMQMIYFSQKVLQILMRKENF